MKPVFAQVAGYGVGNTINLTPAMRAAAEVVGAPVELWLHDESLAELFRDADFLDLKFGRPTSKPFLRSSDVLLRPGKPDWLGAYLKVRDALGHPGPCPPPYVDRPRPLESDFPEVPKCGDISTYPELLHGLPYAVLLRGAATAAWHGKKDPGSEIYRAAARTATAESWIVVQGGSEQDREWWPEEYDNTLDLRGGGLRRQLALLAGADVVIANDTGLAHAAAALGKPVFVLWKSTDLRKNRAQSPAVFYAPKQNWEPALGAWLDNVSPPGGSGLRQVKIWGLKRSGTNWLRWLIDENFEARALMDVLGWKHGKPSEALSWRWKSWFPEWRPASAPGGSRQLSEALQASVEGQIRHVCIVKHPLAWLDSMARYEKRPTIGVGWATSALKVWKRRAEQVRDFIGENCAVTNRAIVRYEDLLGDLEGTLANLGGALGLENRPETRDFDKRLERGNDGMAADGCARPRDHDRAYWLERRYLERMPEKVVRHGKRALDPDLLAFFGYGGGS